MAGLTLPQYPPTNLRGIPIQTLTGSGMRVGGGLTDGPTAPAPIAPSLAALMGTGGVGTDSASDRAYAQRIADEQRANAEWATRQGIGAATDATAAQRATNDRNSQILTPAQQVNAQIERDRVANNARDAAGTTAAAAAQKTRQAGNLDNFEAGLAAQRAAAAKAADLKARQDANAANQDRVLQMTRELSASSSGGGSAAIPPPVSRTSGTNAAQEQAARAAAFSRAKDQAGALTRASLNSLAGEMSGRGVSGSGEEAVRTAGAVGSGAGYLGDITNQQMIADLASATHNADTGYQGDIAQRGQTIDAQNAAAARRAAQQQSMLSLLGQSGSVY